MELCLQIFDGHNGAATAIYSKDNLLSHVMSETPLGLGREKWPQALAQALVTGFVKTSKEFHRKGMFLLILFSEVPCISKNVGEIPFIY